jgi:hypothetical protein
VTKDNGIIPSMSVTRRRLETLLTSGNDHKAPLPQDKGIEKEREAGIAILADKLRADPERARGGSGLEDWMPRTDAVVSR